MTSFLFWNIHKNKSLCELISKAVIEFDVNILIIAECENDDIEIVEKLNKYSNSFFRSISDISEKVRIFTNLPSSNWSLLKVDVSNRMSIREIVIGNNVEVILSTLHLPSKFNLKESEQAHVAQLLISDILQAEKEAKHDKTIVVGDFNQNPFDAGMISAFSFHAVMSKEVAFKGSRTVLSREVQYFYNPMWSFFGDRTPGPPGTYYHKSPGIEDTYWHILDQVILRPSMISHLRDLKIIDKIDAVDLLKGTDRTPDLNIGSDHLPLLFCLDL